jgi:hypothetical protein
MLPSSGLKRLKDLLAAYVLLSTHLAYFSALKTEPVCSSETSVNIYQTTGRNVAGDITIHGHCCESLKSNIFIL